MKNILDKLTAPSSMCYFYIILLLTSILVDPGSTKVLSLLTVTTTLVSVVILLELKNEINSKLSVYYLDFFFVSFIFIKCVISLVFIVFPDYKHIFTSNTFGIITGILQLLYSYFLIKLSNKKIKHLWFYGCLLFGSSIFLIFGPHMEIIFVLSIGSIYILSQAFYELDDLTPTKNNFSN